MDTHGLSEVAERIRCEIKQIIPKPGDPDIQPHIPKADFLTEDKQGVRHFGGSNLALKIRLLKKEMKIDDVCMHYVPKGLSLTHGW